MKKFMMGLVIAGLMTTSAMAAVGTLSAVRATANGTIYVKLQRSSDNVQVLNKLVGTADAIKAMMAVALTAKASASTVDLSFGTYDGVSGWASVNIIQ